MRKAQYTVSRKDVQEHRVQAENGVIGVTEDDTIADERGGE